MSNEPPQPIEIRFTPEFKRNLRALAKKYRNIRLDVDPVIQQLQAGNFPGDQIPQVGYTLFKVRIPNRDARRGKSGRYRINYYLKTPTSIILVTIYSKVEQSDITTVFVNESVNNEIPEKKVCLGVYTPKHTFFSGTLLS